MLDFASIKINEAKPLRLNLAMQQLHSASISRKGIHPPLARSFSGMAGVTAFGGPRLMIFLAVVARRIFIAR